MPTVTEGSLTFDFPDDWEVSPYDRWSYYRNQFQQVCGGSKAVDIVGLESNECLWTIEVKDYRRRRRTKTIDLADEVAAKVRDTLAGLAAAQTQAGDAAEQAAARRAMRCKRFRVVLHLEQPPQRSKLFPRAIDPARVRQRLRQLIKAVDPHPLVLETSRMNGVAWSVR